jgi:hypothetical protein
MGFEIVEPGVMNLVDPLREGEVAIAKSGKLSLRKSDLAVAQIADRVVVLADRELFRIALRAARDDSERARSEAKARRIRGDGQSTCAGPSGGWTWRRARWREGMSWAGTGRAVISC